MNYWENYNASEGFFGVQARPGSKNMRLLMNTDVFYEFIPAANPSSAPVPSWEVKTGEPVSALSGTMTALPIWNGRRLSAKLPPRRGVYAYEEFAAKVPPGEYSSIRQDVMKMMEGARDVLWPDAPLPLVRLHTPSRNMAGKSP